MYNHPFYLSLLFETTGSLLFARRPRAELSRRLSLHSCSRPFAIEVLVTEVRCSVCLQERHRQTQCLK